VSLPANDVRPVSGGPNAYAGEGRRLLPREDNSPVLTYPPHRPQLTTFSLREKAGMRARAAPLRAAHGANGARRTADQALTRSPAASALSRGRGQTLASTRGQPPVLTYPPPYSPSHTHGRTTLDAYEGGYHCQCRTIPSKCCDHAYRDRRPRTLLASVRACSVTRGPHDLPADAARPPAGFPCGSWPCNSS